MPPHCHSLEEEIFVVLEGEGHLLLWEEDGVEEHEVRALAREHVLSSNTLIEVVLETLGASGREPSWGG